MKEINYIIFDFDGTIADTSECIIRSFKFALEKLSLPTVSEESIKAMIGLPLRDMFLRLGNLTQMHEQDEAMEIYREHFDEIYLECVTLFDGVKETLQMLQEQQIVMGIATGRNKASLLNMCYSLEIGPFFHGMFADDDVVEKKPAPEMANKLLELWGVTADKAMVVGDTIYDIEMGQRAGCKTCGVSYGNQTAEQLLTQKPDSVIDKMVDLLTLL